MRDVTKRRAVWVSFSTASVCFALALSGLDETSEVGLTEEETVGVVFFAQHGPAWHLYPHANPKAKPRLYDVLDSPELGRFHGNVYRLLGYIGDAADVDRIQGDLLTRYHDLGGFRIHAVFGAFDGLAVLAGREVPGASEVLNEMRRPDYWKNRPRWFSTDSNDDPLQIAFYVSGAIATRQQRDRQVASSDELLEPFKDTDYDERLRRQIAAALGPNRLRHGRASVTASHRKVANTLYATYFSAKAEHAAPSAETAVAVPEEEETRKLIQRGAENCSLLRYAPTDLVSVER